MNPKHGILALGERRSKVISQLRAREPKLANELANFQMDWYKIRNAADNETTEVFIYDEIDWFWGIAADELVQELNAITSPNIDVRINSPGGSVFDCIAIYNALVKHPANVTVYVDALAASGASIIAMAGDKTVMMVGAQLMIHDALGVEIGNAATMREFATFLDKQSDNLASIYANKAGGDVETWRAMMVAETWMFAQEAVDLKLADEIYTKPPAADKPAEGSPEEEQQEDPEEEKKEEEEEGGTGDNDDDQTQNLMTRNHQLTNRGFRYNGRRRAPEPTANGDYDAFVSSLIDAMPIGGN